jgi:hypothetical protein
MFAVATTTSTALTEYPVAGDALDVYRIVQLLMALIAMRHAAKPRSRSGTEALESYTEATEPLLLASSERGHPLLMLLLRSEAGPTFCLLPRCLLLHG